MSNVAYADFGAKRKQEERPVVADLDNGYTRVADEILEATMASGLNETELCIILAVWRKTYGYNKKIDWISNEQFESMIAKHSTHCSTAKNQLINKKVLIQQGRKVGINTNLNEWETKNNGFCKTLAKSAKKSLAGSAKATKQKLLNTKDNITKDKKDNNTPLTPHEGNEGEVAKPKKRKPTPQINYDDYLNAYNEEVGDRLPHAVEANTKRQRALKKIISKLATQNVDGWRAYVRAFVKMARPFYFGGGDRGWTADIDFLLKETTLTGVREGKFAGKDDE
ncbi:replication protein [Xenorhabdus ehlersii]|uniref:DNA replication protein n=1 Tax=Xenorhabdus ehlersii TaxID=290111 RepID=A0A2D0IME5_9GAMM|nr:replication protein [Xenorhabdus ehlersii]PHM22985.1 DNA replication protein [Xenorhabdus ehlersii]RKE92653.1 phage replication protein O [Xenorhabdus ehlersii]